MKILPECVFKCLARELISEQKKHSSYYLYLYKQDVFRVPGTTTKEERDQEGIRQVSEGALRCAGFTATEIIKCRCPISSVTALFDVIGAMGAGFFLDVEILNNGSLLKKIPYRHADGLMVAQRTFVLELKDFKVLKHSRLLPFEKKIDSSANQANGPAKEPSFPPSCNVAEDVAVSSSEDSDNESFIDSKIHPPPKPDGNASFESASDEGEFEVRGKKRKQKKRPKTPSVVMSSFDSSSDEETPPPKKCKDSRKSVSRPLFTPAESRFNFSVKNEDEHDVNCAALKQKLETTDAVLLKQRQILESVLQKQLDWYKKLQKHVLEHVEQCELCPVHCLPVLGKKITRDSGRKVGRTSKK